MSGILRVTSDKTRDGNRQTVPHENYWISVFVKDVQRWNRKKDADKTLADVRRIVKATVFADRRMNAVCFVVLRSVQPSVCHFRETWLNYSATGSYLFANAEDFNFHVFVQHYSLNGFVIKSHELTTQIASFPTDCRSAVENLFFLHSQLFRT